ncbi:hypothetical protein ABKN59_003101 [Abortiporus biennis]
MQTPRLPIEIQEYIVELCACDGDYDRSRYTLLSCALTCRTWLARSQLHLFSHVIIRNGKTFRAFVNGLKLRPINGYFVHDLEIKDHNAEHSWINLVPLQLPLLLPKLTSLRLEKIQMTNIHPNFFQNFSQFKRITQLVVQSIEFDKFIDFARLVISLPNLRCLQILRRIQWKEGSGILIPHLIGKTLSKKVQLTHLCIVFMDDPHINSTIIDWLLWTSSMKSLKEFEMLCLPYTENFANPVTKFLESCGSSINRLSISVDNLDLLDISPSTSLKILSLTLSSILAFPSIAIPLSQIKSQYIHTIILQMPVQSLEECLGIAWNVLDDSLGTLSGPRTRLEDSSNTTRGYSFPQLHLQNSNSKLNMSDIHPHPYSYSRHYLKTVIVVFEGIRGFDTKIIEREKASIEGKLPKLMMRGILGFIFN